MAGQFRRHRAQLSLRVPRFEFLVRFLLLSSSGPSCSPPEIFSVGILCGASACREAAERFRRHPEEFYPQVLRCAVQVRVWPLLPSSDTSVSASLPESIYLMHRGRLLVKGKFKLLRF